MTSSVAIGQDHLLRRGARGAGVSDPRRSRLQGDPGESRRTHHPEGLPRHWRAAVAHPCLEEGKLLPALGISAEQLDNTWTGWPRMAVKDGFGYVSYTGNAQVCLRTIRIDQLTDWDSESGESVRIA
ncbi:MAG: hypothetical protein J7M39_10785 [Anaerolineae bacterium]|nr:hypothetical protein [Anaerolineae bacterium]